MKKYEQIYIHVFYSNIKIKLNILKNKFLDDFKFL